jgi:flagellar biosynthetic protein FliS
LKHLRLAREGIAEGDARKRGEHLSRAVAIVSTLHTSLEGDAADEPIAFLRGLYQSMLVELGKVAVTHDVNILDLAFRYLERLKQIWEHDVMGRPSQAPEERQDAPPAPTGAVVPPFKMTHPAYGTGPALGQRTFSA